MMGFQCDTWNNTWDYSVNGGSPTQFNDTWAHSSAYCNVHNWAPNAWHHVQIWYTRNTSGWVTCGIHGRCAATHQCHGVCRLRSRSAPVITQFQIDGARSGTSWGNVYLDGLAVYRW